MSIAGTRDQPQVAQRIWGLNGEALDRLAYVDISLAVQDGKTPRAAAADIMPLARQAFIREPLSPSALAVLGLGQSDPARGQALLSEASALDKRDSLLQSAVLQDQLEREDVPGMLTTLDRILRVQVEARPLLFSVLKKALADPASLGAFQRILQSDDKVLPGDTDWRVSFLRSAATDPQVTANLGALRLQTDFGDAEFDRRLLRGLVAQGQVGLASQIYAKAKGAHPASSNTLWPTTLPPFDWGLADDEGFRAEPSIDGKNLDIYVASGEGGVVAHRLMNTPKRVTLSLTMRSGTSDDLRLQASCPGKSPFADLPLASGTKSYDVGGSTCGIADIAIYARATSGESPVDASLGPIQIAVN
jgi:hypothetical protein